MSKFIDLSREIFADMPVYPGDKEVMLENDKILARDHYVNHNLIMGMHVGTHLDLPAHMLSNDNFISDIELDRFNGTAKLIYAQGENRIKYREKYNSLIEKDDIVIIYTGFADRYGSLEYYQEHSVITKDLACFFVKKEIKMLGIDMPSPDYSPYDIHNILFKNNIYILENLCNLDKLLGLKSFEVLVFPLKVRAEAAPVRVAALI